MRARGLPERIPLLDCHARDSVDRVLGHVSGLRVEGGWSASAPLSRHNPQAIRLAQEISDGARFGRSRRLPRAHLARRHGRRTADPDGERNGTCSKLSLSPSGPMIGLGCERNTT